MRSQRKVSRRSPWLCVVFAIGLLVAGCGTSGSTDFDGADAQPQDAAEGHATEPSTTTSPEPRDSTTSTEAGEGTSTDPDLSPTYGSEAESASEPDTDEAPAGLILGDGPTGPGRYTHPVLDRLEMTIDQPLEVLLNKDHILLFAGGDLALDFTQGVLFVNAIGIIPPDEVGVHQPHHPTVPEVAVDLPADLSEWFESVPQAQVTATNQLTVAGMPARSWTVQVDPEGGPTFNDCGSLHCIGFVVNDAAGTYVLRDNETATIYQFDALPSTIGWAFGQDQDSAVQSSTFFETILASLVTR